MTPSQESPKATTLQVAGIDISISYKDIKNTHLSVYPPDGRVHIAAPLDAQPRNLRLLVISKLSWLKKQIKKHQEQAREAPRLYISGESHYLQGKRYLLEVIEQRGAHRIEFRGVKYLVMYVQPDTSQANRQKLMRAWYRAHLKEVVPPLLAKWEEILEVKAADWGIKQMRTRWGTCNVHDARIWLNLELAKKPLRCLEYIIAHELTHLHERHHNARFHSFLNRHMPQWEFYRNELNALPI